MKIYKNELNQETKEIAESLLFNGNGFIGIRNVFDEDYYDDYYTNRHTYLNGFYDTYPIDYPENYYGSAKTGEHMIPVLDGQTTFIFINDIKININEFKITNHERYIDLAAGTTVRKFCVVLDDQSQTEIKITKLTSFTNQEYLATKYEFNKLNHNHAIRLETHINFSSLSSTDAEDPRLGDNDNSYTVKSIDLTKQEIEITTRNSEVSCFFKWNLSENESVCEVRDEQIVIKSNVRDQEFIKTYTYSLEKFIEPKIDFPCLLRKQKAFLDEFWASSKVTIKADEQIEESINYGSYCLLASLGTNDHTSIAAKGLSGLGYEGHVFWDAEMYVFPFFVKTYPKYAKSMLNYRIKMLDKAIENRINVGYEAGALYPWRTITGLESSSFFEAGMAQHHINLDIAYAFITYVEMTDDISILQNGGYEMLYQICLMFSTLVHKQNGKYHLDKVTGPDEYTALVDDNFYTNSLLSYVTEHLITYDKIIGNKLSEKEVELFTAIFKNINLPVSNELGIYAQDRDFLNKGLWPQEELKKPLLLNYHPLYIYRYQICKQADVVLATQLLFDDLNKGDFIKNTIEYYDEITTHDSSLSFSSFATVYAKLKHEKAYEYFLKNARLDLDNLHHNTKDGIHTASMGGTYQTVVEGFANMQINGDEITFSNNLPKQIKYLEFNIYFKGELYNVQINEDNEPLISKKGKNEKSSII